MLIKNTTDFQKYFNAWSSLDITALLPYISTAEQKWLIPLIGQAQYNDIDGAYNTGSPTDDQQDLIDLAQAAISQLGFYLYIPAGQLAISTSGISVMRDSTKSTAWQWQINKLEESCLATGFEALERLLLFLEANKAIYTIWATDPVYAATKELFVNTAADFNIYYNINNSRRLFTRLQPTMRLVHTRYIQTALGNNYYAELLGKNVTNTLNADDNKIITDLKSAIVFYSIYEGLVASHLLLSDLGYTTPNIDNRSEMNIKQTPATENMLQLVMTKALEGAKSSLAKVRDYLNANASLTVFPTYFADPKVYVAPTSVQPAELSNQSSNGYFAV